MYAFSTSVVTVGPSGYARAVRDELTQALTQVKADGRTALNDATCAAVQAAEAARTRDRAAGEQRLYGIVLLTDGQENISNLKDIFACLPTGEDVDGVKVFTIAYGAYADTTLLKKIADRTNGKTFTGDPATIEQVYLSISAEQ